jgi:hypothetical protein
MAKVAYQSVSDTTDRSFGKGPVPSRFYDAEHVAIAGVRRGEWAANCYRREVRGGEMLFVSRKPAVSYGVGWRNEPVARVSPVASPAAVALRPLQVVSKNWDSYGAEAPNDTALSAAEAVLEAAHDILLHPSRLLPTAEGGVGIVFIAGAKEGHIECLNDGEITVSTVDRASGAIHAWSIEVALAKDTLTIVRAYLN